MDILLRTAYWCLAYGGSVLLVALTIIGIIWAMGKFVNYLENK